MAMTAEQVIFNINELQQAVQQLQQGANNSITAMANMQAAVAGLQATAQAYEGIGRGSADGGHVKLNHHAAKGLHPAPWKGEEDVIPFQEFSAEVLNYACALNANASDIMDQAARHSGNIDPFVDIECSTPGLAEAIDGELYRQLYKSTRGEARRVVHNAGRGNGLQAWLNLNTHYAPRSATDAAVAMKKVMYPVRVKNEDKMSIELQKWLADLLEFEQRFHNVDDTSKRCGLQALLPETMWTNRMAGQQYPSFDALLKHVKDIVGDRTISAGKEKKPANSSASHGGAIPMDIGQVEEGSHQDFNTAVEDTAQKYLMAMGYMGKGKGQADWGQPKGKGKGKDQKGGWSKGKGKAKGKGKEKQCWTCGGWGHIAAHCGNNFGGKGVNEVSEEDPHDETLHAHNEPHEEEPAWLGQLADAQEWKAPSSRKTFRQPSANYRNDPNTAGNNINNNNNSRIDFSLARNINNNNNNNSTVNFNPARINLHNPKNFSYLAKGIFTLEDADNEDADSHADDDGDIMVVTEKTGTEAWTKVSAIIDSGAVEHVLPEGWLPTVPLESSPGSRSGKKYLSATGQEIPNKGQKKVIGKTREGQSRGIVFQVAPVRKALISAAKMNEAGNDVNLRGDSPHILNLKTNQVTALRKEGKTYVLDLWVKTSAASGFTRRG